MDSHNEDVANTPETRRIGRRGILKAAVVGAAVAPAPWLMSGAAEAVGRPSTAAAPRLPGLPEGFWKTFTSTRVRVNGIHLHAVTGGRGPAVLLIGGWPQTWYAWRHVMTALARDFRVVVMDPRGVGLSDKPASGYDSGTLAGDGVKLMRALGHKRFALVTHDVGAWTGYALASDHPEAVERFVAMETITPGLTDPASFLLPGKLNSLLWHFPFNRVQGINEQLVRGREEVYFGYQFATKAASPTSMPAEAVKVYIDALKSSPEALRSSFEFYRAIDEIIAQNTERKKTKLRMPVLAVGGELAVGTGVETEMRTVAQNVQSVLIPHAGHFLMDENPDQVIQAITPFLEHHRS
ncbi:alpha/beta fold hydrolase [Streptomyces sp. NPDC001380]|uniref:alpha/beta fold hydrolase n=1 Tax=Streptomyces sp. NPDC001380 TaxID=3364566 RepID=UPI003677AC8C